MPADRENAGADRASPFLLLAIAGFIALWFAVLPTRLFDADEFEHAHAAWCVFKGMVPYRDFFEHHTPWYYYLVAPFFRWFRVDESFASARHFLVFGRGLSVALALISVAMAAWVGRLWRDRHTGLLAGLLLVAQPVWFEKMVEMRPDVLALPLYLASLGLLLRGLATPSAARAVGWFGAAGLALGGAVMCTQKMLFVLPGLLSGLALAMLLAGRSLSREGGRPPLAGQPLGPRAVIGLLAGFLACIAMPGFLTWAAFALGHGGTPFFLNNFALNAAWRQRAHQQMLNVLATSWPVLLLALLGCATALSRLVTGQERRNLGSALLACTLGGLVAGIPIVPVAHRQYYLPILPIVCLFAAHGLLLLLRAVHGRARVGLCVLAAGGLAILPVRDLGQAFATRNDAQLARLRYVFDHTRPDDLVMDGWQGTGVFRPHAFYYAFIHVELLPMLSLPRVSAYLDALERGSHRPRLIALDDNLAALGSRFLRFVHKSYVTDNGFFYLSKHIPP